MNEKRLDKLPKWAQHRIQKLEADVEFYRKASIAVYEGKTNIFYSMNAAEYHGLPPDCHVEFRFGEDRLTAFRNFDHGLYVYSSSRVARPLRIKPCASNAILIEP